MICMYVYILMSMYMYAWIRACSSWGLQGLCFWAVSTGDDSALCGFGGSEKLWSLKGGVLTEMGYSTILGPKAEYHLWWRSRRWLKAKELSFHGDFFLRMVGTMVCRSGILRVLLVVMLLLRLKVIMTTTMTMTMATLMLLLLVKTMMRMRMMTRRNRWRCWR